MYIRFGWFRFSNKLNGLGKRKVWVALDCPYLAQVKYWVIRGKE
jgi:hypothetical protein